MALIVVLFVVIVATLSLNARSINSRNVAIGVPMVTQRQAADMSLILDEGS